MLTLHTNFASLSAQNSLARTQIQMSTAQTRLSTGYRINSAMDDAAGLQITTRLRAQTSGMAVAMRNTQNATSIMQTAEGAFNEVNSMLTRMKDLATQAADGSSSSADWTAMQSEYDTLGGQITQIITNTTFGGMNLLSDGNNSTSTGVMANAITFQIGANSNETFAFDISGSGGSNTTGFSGLQTNLAAVSTMYQNTTQTTATPGTELTTSTGLANSYIALLDKAIASVSELRSDLGAAANRLDHVYNNLNNMSTNVQQASGRIMDTDYASETANQTSKSMLMQAGTAMLKQSGQMSQMVLSLLQ